jgi:SAM-dependent methyltransferase
MIISSPYFIIKRLQQEALKRSSVYITGRVFDMGCGVRPYKNFLACSRYIGMDESIEVKPDIVGNAQIIPFKEGSFDSVLCTEVLEHLPEPGQALKEIKRALKKEGYLYLTVPQEWCLHYEPHDYFRFTSFGIKHLLENNGFKIMGIERIGGIFSLVGQRIIDVFWQFAVDCLKAITGHKWAERLASNFFIPASLFVYLLGRLADGIDQRDALGWAVLARKL